MQGKKYGREQVYAEPMHPSYGKHEETTNRRKQIQEQRSRELDEKLKTADFAKSQRECWVWGAVSDNPFEIEEIC